jgi:hypothetical protein
MHCQPAALSASVPADSMKTLAEYSGCERNVLITSTEKEDSMHSLTSPIQYLKLRRVHKKRKQIALHMLALSGVVRPSHVELRYQTQMAHNTASDGPSARSGDPLTHPLPLRSWDHRITLTTKQTRQWASSLSSAIVQLAKSPIQFRATKQLDL